MKQSVVSPLLGVLTLLSSLFILPVLPCGIWVALWGPGLYDRSVLRLLQVIWLPMTSAMCAYLFVTIWANVRAWKLFQQENYKRAIRIGLTPYLLVAIMGGSIWLSESVFNLCYHLQDCLPRYQPPPTPTFSALTFSGYPGKLLYSSSDGLIMLEFSTGQYTQLPPPLGNGQTLFATSPDDKQGIVLDLNSNNWEVMNLDTQQTARLSIPKDTEWLNWSPDGKRMVYVSETDNHGSVFIIDLQSKTTKQFILPTEQLAPIGSTINSTPLWSPDGTQLLFSMRGKDVEQIYTLSLSCPDATVCRARKVTSGQLDMQPTWSPDGSKIAYSGYPNKIYGSALYIVNVDGSGERQLTHRDPHEDGADNYPT